MVLTSSVRKSSLALSVDAIGQVTQTYTSTDLDNARCLIQCDGLERLQIND